MGMQIASKEVFGPVVSALRFGDGDVERMAVPIGGRRQGNNSGNKPQHTLETHAELKSSGLRAN